MTELIRCEHCGVLIPADMLGHICDAIEPPSIEQQWRADLFEKLDLLFDIAEKIRPVDGVDVASNHERLVQSTEEMICALIVVLAERGCTNPATWIKQALGRVEES